MTLHFTPVDVARFRRYVDVLPGRLLLPDGRELSACHIWTGARSRGGDAHHRKWYGSFRVGRRVVRAHRFACLAAGRDDCPPGWDRDHLCVNSLCVNDEHVEYVPKIVNQRRRDDFALQRLDPARMAGVSDRGGSPA